MGTALIVICAILPTYGSVAIYFALLWRRERHEAVAQKARERLGV